MVRTFSTNARKLHAKDYTVRMIVSAKTKIRTKKTMERCNKESY